MLLAGRAHRGHASRLQSRARSARQRSARNSPRKSDRAAPHSVEGARTRRAGMASGTGPGITPIAAFLGLHVGLTPIGCCAAPGSAARIPGAGGPKRLAGAFPSGVLAAWWLSTELGWGPRRGQSRSSVAAFQAIPDAGSYCGCVAGTLQMGGPFLVRARCVSGRVFGTLLFDRSRRAAVNHARRGF